MRVFYVYQKEGEMTDALGRKTQETKKQHYGVFKNKIGMKSNTPVRTRHANNEKSTFWWV